MKYVKPVEQLEKNVKEKYDDYKYNFKDHKFKYHRRTIYI